MKKAIILAIVGISAYFGISYLRKKKADEQPDMLFDGIGDGIGDGSSQNSEPEEIRVPDEAINEPVTMPDDGDSNPPPPIAPSEEELYQRQNDQRIQLASQYAKVFNDIWVQMVASGRTNMPPTRQDFINFARQQSSILRNIQTAGFLIGGDISHDASTGFRGIRPIDSSGEHRHVYTFKLNEL